MPELWAILAEQPVANEALLAAVLSLLADWAAYPSESAAVLGVNQLHHLLQQQAAAGRLAVQDGEWRKVMYALRGLCLADPLDPEVLMLSPPRAATPGRTLAARAAHAESAVAAAAVVDTARRRCRLAVLLQRVVDALLRQHAAQLPGRVQLDLLELLFQMVEAAAAFNNSPSRRASLERVLAAAEPGANRSPASAGSEAQLSGQDSPPARPAPEIVAAAAAAAVVGPSRRSHPGGGGGGSRGSDASWEVVEEGGRAEGPAAAAVSPPPRSSIPGTPAVVVGRSGGSGGWDALLPALARQEVEGGCLYLAALQRSCSQPSTADGTEEAVHDECASRVAAYCQHVVATAGAAAASNARNHEGDTSLPAASRSAPSAAAAAAEQSWLEAVRAPLVEAALLAFGEMSPEAWQRQQAAAFPMMALLMCNPNKGVRQALRDLMRKQVLRPAAAAIQPVNTTVEPA